MPPHAHNGPAAQLNGGNFHPQQGNFHPQGSVGPVASQATPQVPPGPGLQHNSDVLGNLFSQKGPNTSMGSQQPLSSSTGALAIVAQPPKDSKFEPKSAVWADTLSRGLVNLNISGGEGYVSSSTCLLTIYVFCVFYNSFCFVFSFAAKILIH